MATRKLARYQTLSVPERILVLQDLWDEIASTPEAVLVTDEQRALLDSRLEAHSAGKGHLSGWPEVRARIRKGR